MNLPLLVILYITSYLYITYKPITTYHLMDESYDNGNVMITNIKNYKELIHQKVKYIKKNKTIFDNVNNELVDAMMDKVNNQTNFDITKLIINCTTIPGSTVGYYSSVPYEDTLKKVCFQLEQGDVGWYWLYGTFPDTKDCFLYQLTRFDLLPTDIRKKLGYKLGETTVYCVTLGIGNGIDYYYGNVYFEGIFTIKNNLQFSIVSKDYNLMFSHDYNGMMIQCKDMILTNNKTNENIRYTFNATTQNNNEMFFNQYHGCYPCEINNSYQSYTNLYINANYFNEKGLIKNLENGFGWMDHQWAGSNMTTILYKCILSILDNGKDSSGLPPYIWLNIRLSDNSQYMIFNFTKTVKKGDTIKCNINTYKPSKITFFKDQSLVNVIIKETILFENIEYPIIYEVHIDDHVYVLDSRVYGNTIFRDLNNTWHWGGSCDVYENNKIVGMGFLEAQKLNGYVESLNDTVELIGFTKNENFGSVFYNKRYYTKLFISYVILLFMLLLICLIFYNIFKFDKKLNILLYSILFIFIIYIFTFIQPSDL